LAVVKRKLKFVKGDTAISENGDNGTDGASEKIVVSVVNARPEGT